MVHYHASRTYKKHVTSLNNNSLSYMTLNIRYPHCDLRLLPCKNWHRLGWIWVWWTIDIAQAHFDGLLSSIWDLYKSMLHHTWYGWIDPHDPQHRISPSWIAPPTMSKSALSRSDLGVWYHCHVPRSLYWFIIINLGLIQSMLHHQIVIVFLAWASTPDIPIVNRVFYHAKIGSVIVGVGCVVPVPWSKPTVMVSYHPYGTHTKHLGPQDSNSLPCMTINT